MLNCTTLASKISSVDIHNEVEGWDDGDPLYEVDCTITFNDGSTKDYSFDWVRCGHYASLQDPSTDEAKIDIADLIEDYDEKVKDRA